MQEETLGFTWRKFFQFRKILLQREGKDLTISSLKSDLE